MNTQEEKGVLSEVVNIPSSLKEVAMAPKNKLIGLLEYFVFRKPVTKMLYLSDLKMSTCHTISGLSFGLVASDKEGETDRLMDFVNLNTYQMALIVATAIHNKNTPVPQHLVKTIADNFSNEELKITMGEVTKRLKVGGFLASTSLVKALDLM